MQMRAGPHAQGFILIMVLAMLVVLALLASSIALISERVRDEQIDRQRQFQDALDMASTHATVGYLLISQRMTFAGLTIDDQMVRTADEEYLRDDESSRFSLAPVGNEIRLDGTAYQGIGRVAFALQDDRGLIGVNWGWPPWLERVFEHAGVAASERNTLPNLLLDYQDIDDLYRLNSAERDAYAREGRPPPSNRTLATPLELRRVMGWDEALSSFDDLAIMDTFTVARSPSINVNTAPARVLRTLTGVDEAAAQRIIAVRSVAALMDISVLGQILGTMPPESEMLFLYPSDSGVLKLWSADGGTVRVLHWTITPIDDGSQPWHLRQPWHIDYEFTLAQSKHADQAVARPTQAAIFAESVPAP
ncbi:MAG: type II secretion system protein GspK [Xanthomonadaceae bacterium]|nr:type II secretion system protein GspK [Xanthomonadaceae bacterium]MDP2184490.1 type II secretion system protein GspK [Xanthomonadales bacterium]MDZ4115390.1 type II secretion system protein GspK [Xanthomonadaceae bacterium]MDZ4379564.1 type II secretion system protein GspK [Xanthomonadaceae bacterium]